MLIVRCSRIPAFRSLFVLLQGFLFLRQGALLHLRLQCLGTKFDVGILQVFLRLPGHWDWRFIARCFAYVDCEQGAYKEL